MPLQATSGAASYDAFGGGVPVVPTYIEDIFSCFLYTGTVTSLNITNGIDLSTKGGLIWTKERNNTASHLLIDSQRGLSGGFLRSNTTDASDTSRVSESISSFNTDGYSLHAPDTLWNRGSYNYVSWTFRKQPKFFDVVTYTGDGTNSRDISHNLQVTPAFIIVKCTSNTTDWAARHVQTSMLLLNTTDAANASATFANGSISVSLSTSTTFRVLLGAGSTLDNVNRSGYTYVAYLFASNEGGFGLTGTDNVISCGSFTTDGSGNATVSLGYEPQWIIVKNSSGAGDWYTIDNMRGWSMTGGKALSPNSSTEEFAFGDSTYLWQPTSTGFLAANGMLSASSTFIYIAIRRGPMKVPTLGTSVYTSASRTGTASVIPRWAAGFPVDWALRKSDVTTGGGDWQAGDRLRGAVQVKPNLTEAESAASPLYTFDSMTGYSSLGATGSDTADRSWMFRRAPNFFDEVCYTGDGVDTGRTITHNLTVAPQLMIIKRRSAASANGWPVYVPTSTAPRTNVCLLNTTGAAADTSYFNSTAPTSTVFSVNDHQDVNASGNTYVAYLFATCAGVSKVGRYTGTATTLQIDCGFTGGARFVLIKRTDSTGDWYVWDSARGIVSGNDPYLLLNTTDAEVTGNDYIDTYSAGFEISSTAPAAINASAGTFVFLAVAQT